MNNILIIGACGQLGTELTLKLRSLKGKENVIASDLSSQPAELIADGPYELLDILNADRFHSIVKGYQITQIYHLAAMLSAKSENKPLLAWKLNMESLLTVLEAGKNQVEKIFWPSSIAVFGRGARRHNTPQHSITNPDTVYGISKLAGERWCKYYFEKFGVDVRSLRLPGLIGFKILPGGGTTDYAVHIFHKAIANDPFECFLKKDTVLPMMYIADAVKAIVDLMETDSANVKVRSSYNLAALSFTPGQIAHEIKKYFPEFCIEYKPDFRQQIAESWPETIDDQQARDDWNWQHEYGLTRLVKTMIAHLKGEMVFN